MKNERVEEILRGLVVTFAIVFLFANVFLCEGSRCIRTDKRCADGVAVHGASPLRLRGIRVGFGKTRAMAVKTVRSKRGEIVRVPRRTGPTIAIRINKASSLTKGFTKRFDKEVASKARTVVCLRRSVALRISSGIVSS